MQQLNIDFDEVINSAVAQLKSPELRTVIAKNNCGNFSILTKSAHSGIYFWSLFTAWKSERFAGSAVWSTITDAIKSALHDGGQIFVFDDMREFCSWYGAQEK